MTLELLSPAGNLSKLKTAIRFGADAVYFGGEEFSLRAAADNFTFEDVKEGITFAHGLGKKCYCAVNVMPRNSELHKIPEFLEKMAAAGADAFIISDLGMLSLARRHAKEVPIHISTQTSIVNSESAKMWHELGAQRIVLARELSLDEITEIRANTPKALELEAFVHGAMCVSYSGRCLLSNYMTGRDANHGECAHPCRWKYFLMEEKRPGEYFELFENENGAFVMNSKDLCMIEHIDKLAEAGITSLKIEGRVKSDYYVATVTNAYRLAIDSYMQNPESFKLDTRLFEEVEKVSHRDYYTGFYFGDQRDKSLIYESSSYIRECDIVAVVDFYDEKNKMAYLTQKNKFLKGDELELLEPLSLPKTFKAEVILNGDGEEIESAPHPEMKLKIPLAFPVQKYSIIRKNK